MSQNGVFPHPARPNFTLPIDGILPELQDVLTRETRAVLTAQPGAGKTTRVPLSLLDHSCLGEKRIILLEPRRLAARAAARFMASQLREHVGQTVGYRVRMDTRVSAMTRIEVVTEGVLTRMLQDDPWLSGYGAVLFDEFHERHLQSDLGLALCLDVQKQVRPDLRLLIMSATLDCEAVSVLLGEAPILTCEGRQFSVDTHYMGKPQPPNIEAAIALVVKQVLKNEHGSVLVFLPGGREIRRVHHMLTEMINDAHVIITPLYGDLPLADQDRAIQPAPAGHRKIVLASAIAETSLTIEGIRVVIDSGLARVPRYDPRSGMSRLATVRVTRDCADQRRGRAGRLETGVCYRLWSQHDHHALLPHAIPEILETDLTALALELAVWGTSDPNDLSWLNPPPSGALSQARDLLRQLEAVDDHGRVTAHGRRMAALAVHPRLAHMILKAPSSSLVALACDLAVMLEERAGAKGVSATAQPDVRQRLDGLLTGRSLEKEASDRGVSQRIRRVSELIQKQVRATRMHGELHQSHASEPAEPIGFLLALAYPDRIAQRQHGQDRRYRLANGRGAFFVEPHALAQESYLVIPQLGGDQQDARIFLAAPLVFQDLEAHCPGLFRSHETVAWDDQEKKVIACRQQRIGDLVIKERQLPQPDPTLVTRELVRGIRAEGVSCLPWTRDLRNWQARVEFLRRLDGDSSSWPDVSDARLQDTLESWLASFLSGLTSLAQVRRLDLRAPLCSLLSWAQQKALDEQAPTHLVVPSGSRVMIDYASSNIPIVAVRLQEVFGLQETPTIAQGRVAVLIHLLSPARRPVQVTQDLASFWKTGYLDVKKELKGRYPKHHWPDDPVNAVPTRSIKRAR